MVKFVVVILLSLAIVSSAELNQENSCGLDQDGCCLEDSRLDEGLLSKPKPYNGDSFRAGVVEFQIVHNPSRPVADDVNENLAIYKKIAKVASENGVSVLVFPEDGLFLARGDLEPVLTYIPDPHSMLKNESNPCQQPTLFESSYILRNLSCIAKENNLYLIANFGTKESCLPETMVGGQKGCPNRGYKRYNTDIVIDPRGNFIERYRKYNLFVEVFDKAPSLEIVHFDTPYGRFGIFTCFDMMFARPALDLVEKYHINTAIFPTLWYDELPILSALQYQDGWSWTNKVNLLAANIHRPESGTTGSAIFSGYNAVYTSSNAQKSRLLIANVPVSGSALTCNKNFNDKIIELESDMEDKPYHHIHYALSDGDFTYVLKKREDKQTICQGQVCCTIDYKVDPSFSDTDFSEKLVVIVRDGLRGGLFNWYEQVCLLATLKAPHNMGNPLIPRFSEKGLIGFEKLSIKGTFTTKYVYPIAAHNVTELVQRYRRKFECDHSEVQQGKITCQLDLSRRSREKAIYSFGMYARAYDSDKMPEWWINGGDMPFSFAVSAAYTLDKRYLVTLLYKPVLGVITSLICMIGVVYSIRRVFY